MFLGSGPQGNRCTASGRYTHCTRVIDMYISSEVQPQPAIEYQSYTSYACSDALALDMYYPIYHSSTIMTVSNLAGCNSRMLIACWLFGKFLIIIFHIHLNEAFARQLYLQIYLSCFSSFMLWKELSRTHKLHDWPLTKLLYWTCWIPWASWSLEDCCKVSCRWSQRGFLQYIPRNMHTVLLCFALLWLCNRS